MSYRRAFTLVELLVVIGIIALLISILLPALNKARDQARRVACASQQRQVCMAIRMYADEFKGWLPSNYSGSPNVIIGGERIVQLMGGKADWGIGFPYWMTENAAQLNSCPGRPSDPLIYDWPYYRDFGTYIYPQSGEQTGITTTYMYYGGAGGYNPSTSWYGWYAVGTWLTQYQDPEQSGPVPKLNSRKRSAEVALLTDRMWPSSIPSPVFFGFMNYAPPNHMANNKCVGGNVTCLDGHTEWRRIEDTKQRILDSTGVCYY